MSCRQTQPVVLRRGVRFRHGSLFLTKQLLVCTRSLWNRSRDVSPHFLLASSIYRCLVCIWPVWRKPHQHKPDQLGVCDHVNWRHLYKRGWVTWMEMITDRRCSIWFPTRSIAHHEIHLWMQNKLYFPAAQTCQSKGDAMYGVWGNWWISIDV